MHRRSVANLSEMVCCEYIYTSRVINKTPGSENSVSEPNESALASRKLSFSMPTPTPTTPRSSAPPQSEKEMSKLSDTPPAPLREGEIAVPEADVPVTESTPDMLADVKGEEASTLPSDDDLTPLLAIMERSPTVPEDKSPLPAEDEEFSEPLGNSNLLVEMPTPISRKPGQSLKSDNDKELASVAKNSVPFVDNIDGVDQGASVTEHVITLKDESGPGPVNPPPKPGAHRIQRLDKPLLIHDPNRRTISPANCQGCIERVR